MHAKSWKLILTTLVLVAIAGSAAGVEPAYRGPMGNPEEPALRPVKWLWHGTKALAYRATNGIRDTREDRRFRSLLRGTARGAGEGVAEVGESVFRGAIHSQVPRNQAYKERGLVNRWITDQAPYYIGAAEQKERERQVATDLVHMPPTPDGIHEAPREARSGSSEQEPEMLQSAREAYLGEQRAKADRAEAEPVSRVQEARERYLGDRARVNPPRPGRGNLLRLGR